ncbi:bifunctional diaminohydroxyphosphoribosylaminopyrimidine deaminase/5-amino-6-(5-phosphoribosylamino)uracil reductase RibD [Gloeocapsa sp. PCC 73106]|uniref:bifunctional diaminohydroxyphosphoribosylaminopyrimidine deaminase/5-amino-6-(5-phosphoribosylamino)uracil reductase RibD n=1 Tax=Gloeocapsa sp. PCC 73106 TaxID=102232 RepID=UPI0002ACCBB5|nr:bifunctional diaminohydroxyphosphoribosylaminopyrimidine deaminase/5-amino-6-(5-phosphoribosylamino)uracil reductase RibD [Gloeocapsa sp. PCC 73106]ELR96910.1 diaminohydroxyphosphoribosylaminopyrimidine deaminase [Gloeocapsa sp. PCC 73106]
MSSSSLPNPRSSLGNAFDRQMMQRALELARTALGKTAPNPMVGAVIVQGEKIVGEGFHPGAGQPHAEVFALKQAGPQAKGATIYVTLEPCNHYGRTPPCTEALISMEVARVIVGMVDPDPRVSGKGIEKLLAAGMEVIVGVETQACQELNEGFVHRVTQHRPFGTLKYAMTLDGKIATTTGDSAWITGKDSREFVYQLRAASDAVIIGGSTLRQDNPHLTTHGVADRSPLRVVMSRGLNLPLEANLWNIQSAPTLVLTETGANQEMQAHLREKGVEIVELEPLEPATVMEYFYQRQFCSVLWECGQKLAASAIAAGAVQKVMAFIAPKIIGGLSAPSPVGDLGLVEMKNALDLQSVTLRQFTHDFLIQGYLR